MDAKEGPADLVRTFPVIFTLSISSSLKTIERITLAFMPSVDELDDLDGFLRGHPIWEYLEINSGMAEYIFAGNF